MPRKTNSGNAIHSSVRERVRRGWIASLMSTCLATGSMHAFAHDPHCDSGCASCCNAGVGVRIPSLQVLFVDKLSAAGDRLERAQHKPKPRCDTALHLAPYVARRSAPSHRPDCDSQPSLPPIERRTKDCTGGGACDTSRVALPNSSGRISDSTSSRIPAIERQDPPTPPAQTALPPIAQPSSEFSKPLVERTSPKLLPTPASEAPPIPPLPVATVQPLTPDTQVPIPRPMPEVPEVPTPAPVPVPEPEEATQPVEEPLPDILVDPFMDDTSSLRPRTPQGEKRVALSGFKSSRRPAPGTAPVVVPHNALRDPKASSTATQPAKGLLPPKRLTPSQKGEQGLRP